MVGLFFGSGVAHLVAPAEFLALMPPVLPYPLFLVYASGVAEIISAAGLLARYRWAPVCAVLVLLGVWPANWWFAIDAVGSLAAWMVVVAWLRLPLQIPLVVWAWRSPTRARKERGQA